MPEVTRRMRKELERENNRWPELLVPIPPEHWPMAMSEGGARLPNEVWRSRYFLLQVFQQADDVERLSVIRTKVLADGWAEDITWDELQSLKRQCGRGNQDAVEVYPCDDDIINVANMRHLWVLPVRLNFVWRNKKHEPTTS